MNTRDLRDLINSTITTNGKREITGAKLNTIFNSLLTMIEEQNNDADVVTLLMPNENTFDEDNRSEILLNHNKQSFETLKNSVKPTLVYLQYLNSDKPLPRLAFQLSSNYNHFLFGYPETLQLDNVEKPIICLDKHFKLYSSGKIANVNSSNKAGDVAYWDGNTVKTIPYEEWSTDLGTPVGVVVVPEGFAPDGRTRIAALDAFGCTRWSNYNFTTSATTYNSVPHTSDLGVTVDGLLSCGGYLPTEYGGPSWSDYTKCPVDTSSYYKVGSDVYTLNHTVSPYYNGQPNPDYFMELFEGNALSCFNGFEQTKYLVNTDFGSTPIVGNSTALNICSAAKSCYEYTDNVSNLQWYLPAAGELGFLSPRYLTIRNTIINLGGYVSDEEYRLVSSTEMGGTRSGWIWVLTWQYGLIGPGTKEDLTDWDKQTSRFARPFAML